MKLIKKEVVNMKKGDISIETLFWILMFVVSLAVIFYVFVRARGQTIDVLGLLPI